MTTATIEDTTIESVVRLDRDLRRAGATLGDREARYLVDAYYQTQEYRIAAHAQLRAATDDAEPHAIIEWHSDQMELLERVIKNQLGVWAASKVPGEWALSIPGIGPVLAAGLLAHIDITKAPTVGHIWSFAGLDPNVVWAPKTKRPWNADLKVICWKIGESFIKVSNRDNDIYGHVYAARKLQEITKNEAGDFADQAAATLLAKKFGQDTMAIKYYQQGKLPPARIHARARRYSVKLFLSHLHHVMYESHYGTQPPKPYIIEHGGHVHFVRPPHWENGMVVIPDGDE
jgi:hypothetical protein